MKKIFFYTFAVNIIFGIVAAFVWIPKMVGLVGYLVAVIYAGLVIIGASSFPDELNQERRR